MKTKAAILYELNRPLRIEDVEIPSLKCGQVLVKILCTGICGAQYNEMIGLKGPDRFLPHMLGHEASAIVQDIGEGVTKVKPGDYVVLSWVKGHGLDGVNTQFKSGSTLINAGAVTTFSEYSVVSENRITPISSKIPADIAAIMGCAIITGCGIVHNTIQLQRKDSIIVFGAGGIGLSVILGARQAGCSNIIAVDLVDKKLELALTLGATFVINPKRDDLKKKLSAILPDGVDYAVDASGAKESMETAFDVIKTKGTCVIAGNLSKDKKIEIHPFELIKGKKIIGTWGGESSPDRDIPKYEKGYLSGELPMGQLITHRYRLEDINEAFAVLKNGDAGRIVLAVNESL